MNKKYPPYEEIAGVTQLRELYEKAVGEIDAAKAEAKMHRVAQKDLGKDKQELRREVKRKSFALVEISKKQKAAEEANKSAAWSGAAAISVTILYETWKVVGFPGGQEWLHWWNHEAIYGVMMWIATITFAYMHKLSKS